MIRVSHTSQILKGTINLPSSKSISNRMLILQKLYEPNLELANVSAANDTQLLREILVNDLKTMNVQDAGTAFRFLVGYTSCTPGEYVINGTKRLQERPIAELVDALRIVGADITYLEKEGHAPLKIVGKDLEARTSLLDLSNVKSSQFISALLLIAPRIKGDFNIKVNVKMSSFAFVLLTISCLRRMGFSVWVNGSYIKVSKQQKFDGEYFYIEPDWSSFYYWYSKIHLAEQVDLFFPGLRLNNMQKERRKLYDVGNTAIRFEEMDEGLRITKNSRGTLYIPERLNYRMFPDIIMTFAMLIPAVGGKQCEFKGLESLQYKECDREIALQNHLAKVGATMTQKNNVWLLKCEKYELTKDTFFESYNDHRMAMCVAPLALQQRIVIEDETVVKKSYPHYWEDLESVGFTVEKVPLNT